MSKKYENQPITEALCEFQFIPGQPWDMTIPGLIYGEIKSEFPDKKQQINVGFQSKPLEKGDEHKIGRPVLPILQCFKKNKTALIQVAENLLAVNQLEPYPGWESFKKMILENFRVYKKVADPKGFRRIGLRYVNVFDFEKTEKVELKDYFKYYPFIPEDLPQEHGPFSTRVEFPYGKDNENLILSLGTAVPKEPDTLSLVLDIDYAMTMPESVSVNEDKISNWLDNAHKKIETAFEACITDKTRKGFEEADNADSI